MPGEKIERELRIINSLLRSKEFSFEMAKALNTGYNTHTNKKATAEGPDTITTTVLKEKIASNLAGFYAVECGVGLLCEQSHMTPVEWLQKIVDETAGPDAVLLLNRFANATWKAGQPFRSFDRITRCSFTGAGYLPPEELQKDYAQVLTAASQLLDHMKPVKDLPLGEQMNFLKKLLQDKAFAFYMAKCLDSSYHGKLRQQVPLIIPDADVNETIQKNAEEMRVATSIAGFYALECGINYLVTTKGLIPSDILRSILNNSIDEADKTLLLRLANATWKAGQPFRDLNRITRDAFVPVYFLSNEDIEKDMVQIKTAAQKLLETLESYVQN